MSEAAAQHPSEVSADRFRAVLGRFATGVSIMTTTIEGRPHGMTANAVTSVSLAPPLVLVCVARTTVMADVVARSKVFGLSFLAEDQARLSEWFADADRPGGQAQFGGITTFAAATGSPLIEPNVGWLDCRVWAVYDGGDHLIFVGRVVELSDPTDDRSDDDAAPLLYHRGDYTRLAGTDR